MPQITYQDMTISVNAFTGQWHVKLGTFDKTMSSAELAQLLYPVVKQLADPAQPDPAPAQPST